MKGWYVTRPREETEWVSQKQPTEDCYSCLPKSSARSGCGRTREEARVLKASKTIKTLCVVSC